MIVAKIHRIADGIMLSVCDQELIGKKFYDGNLQLDLSSDFYKGDVVSEEKLKELMTGAKIINIVGEKSVNVALRIKILDKKEVMYIKGVPHAQIVEL